MNKSALRSFATYARRELIDKIKAKAMKIGITEEKIKQVEVESSDAVFIDGKQLSSKEKNQRKKLIKRIEEKGFNQLVDEVAYTWFNRFTALRFMEVNEYLPSKVRVLSSSNSEDRTPDIIKEAMSLEFDIDKEWVYERKINNENDKLFQYLIIMQCNDLNDYMPFMFEKIDDYTEILFPEGLLSKESFLRRMTDTDSIPEEDWTNVEIIGWLYQFYITEEKDRVFTNLKKNIKITKDTLPSATQLFTPNWIVRYMVENSLGSLWLESYPETLLKSDWKYYVDDRFQEEKVIKQLEEIKYSNVNPEDITFLDPCCGSGHILVYAFDVFYGMYLEKGYIETEIPKLILEKNLYGLDIDDRAVQLASFAVMMKARGKSRRVFRQKINLNICAIQESNWISEEVMDVISEVFEVTKGYRSDENYYINMLEELRSKFWDAKEYGSIIDINSFNINSLEQMLNHMKVDKYSDLFDMSIKTEVIEKLPGLILQAKILSSKYDIVCTNPPYMGSKNMSESFKKYVQKNYKKGKRDLYGVFIEVVMNLTKKNGYCSLVTMHSWLFLNSYEDLRKSVIDDTTIKSIVHLGMEAFEGIIGKVVQTVSFVLKKSLVPDYKPFGVRLVDYYDSKRHEKESQFFNEDNRYSRVKQSEYYKIPGNPIAYWLSDVIKQAFLEGQNLENFVKARQGLATGDNNTFLRYWHEIDYNKIGFDFESTETFHNSGKMYAPYNKGGSFRKWYGNNELIIKFNKDNYNILSKQGNKLPSKQFYFKESLTWGTLTNSYFNARFSEQGSVFDTKGSSCFASTKEDLLYVLGYLNSVVCNEFLNIISPTLDFNAGSVAKLPLIINQKEEVISIVNSLIELTKEDWDSSEVSYGFKKHPFYRWQLESETLEDIYKHWYDNSLELAETVKSKEEELNKLFIENYKLCGEVTPFVEDKDLSLRSSNQTQIIKDYFSYFIGCILGRYSLDEDGIVYAGGNFDKEKYKTFKADEDNIVPIISDAYFEDDIVSRFEEFIKVSFGKKRLDDNLEFVANSLGKKKSETPKETIRRYFLNDFFKDHVQTYKKRPVYWLFTSGKQKAFTCLVYIHRYNASLLSRIRTDYLHELQTRMDTERESLLDIIDSDSTSKEITQAKKDLKVLEKKIEELRDYDEVLHHMADQQIEIDLDDGVEFNYDKFKGLLAKK